MKRIERQTYLSKLIAFKDKNLIKVITGIRRCGKSTIMEIYRDWLLQHGVLQEQIVYLNFEDYDYYELRDPKNLYAYIKPLIQTDRMTYIFFDEIQHVKDFPDIINSLNLKSTVDLYITGSNAYMLSSEIATYLSGRYVEIAMLPLSFREYVDGIGGTANLSQAYMEYISKSSFPYTLDLDSSSEISDYLNGVYNTIVVKDIMARKKLPDVMMLESVIRFVADNIGNILSTKRIADIMTADGRKIDQKTVERYLSALCETFFVYEAKRFNIKGKQLLKTLGKYYLVDIGLRRMLLGSRSFDAGRILENIVYLELLHRQKKVYIGKMDALEVDFVAMDEDGIVYYQVAATVRDEATLNRELASLQQINDQYPKYILTLDDDPTADYDGIKRINALQWLVGE
ncbi:MAG: ATP-binding protein [Prevotella sp.]|uniref:ATP-binding protein n=1 Tax=Prevotella sp. TaxID=59823 RepID=UPI00033E205B|nr:MULTISPECIES: ATP-binding protein [unclassified Prevotella]MBD9298457.1 ATP-binding protein [Prevotella sp.]CDD18935.1 aTPase [Prevotella sp. CAG:732]